MIIMRATLGIIVSTIIVLLHRRDALAISSKAKIVVLPFPVVTSTYINMLEVAEEMGRRGNEVTILTTDAMKKKKSPIKHIDYEVSTGKEMLDEIQRLSKGVKKHGLFTFFSVTKIILQLEYESCLGILNNNETRKAVIEADLIVTLSAMVCGSYLADIYDKPFIVVHPGLFPLIGSFAQVPLPPSYVPLAGSESTEKMTLLERTRGFVLARVKDIVIDVAVTYHFRNLQERFNWKSTERFSQLFGKAEMYIVTIDFSFEFVHPLMPDVFVVGTITAKPPKALPNELEEFMQSSGEHGVVVISFGSAIMNLNSEVLGKIMTALSQLKQKVIWKINVPNEIVVPENVKIVKWLPQNDLLGHEKTKAFVSHMGFNGASEAAYHGVPIVAACITSDSYANTAKFGQKAKMAKFIDVYGADSVTWKETIEEVIYNKSYKENAMRTSKLMRSWPRTSLERAGDAIQYAIDNGGRLPHLKSYASNLYWFQYHCIDVLLLLFALLSAGIFLFCKIAKVVFGMICGRRNKAKTE